MFGGVWIESCKNPIITRKVLKLMFTIVVRIKRINKILININEYFIDELLIVFGGI